MALNPQENWNVEMSQPLKLSHLGKTVETKLGSNTTVLTDKGFSKPWTHEILLPTEVISNILSFIPHSTTSQPTLWSLCLLSRSYYSATIARLYASPNLTPRNFDLFVRIICPSINASIRTTPLSSLVKTLDMSQLVHNSSKSLTARILGRLKGNLETFIAPQASFAINSLAALSKCIHLRVLDLHLISASIETTHLFTTLSNLRDLETLYFPRSSGTISRTFVGKIPMNVEAYIWPPKIRALHLAGGIDNLFLEYQLVNAPSSLERLSIQHCPLIDLRGLEVALFTIGPQLKHLTLLHPLSRLYPGSLDEILTLYCPNLVAFRVSADYIDSSQMFPRIPKGHPLQILDLHCSSMAGPELHVYPGDIYDAVEQGRLTNLRSVRANTRLAWGATSRLRQDMIDLGDIMEENEMERPLGVEPCGVYMVND